MSKGRKKISYNNDDLEREPMIMLVCGETGVGKTYRSRQEILHYLKDDPTTGKKGRKVLAFDTNSHDYPLFKTVEPQYIKALTKVSARRILPYNKDGSPMSDDEKKEVVENILRHFKNGLIVLDDIDHYMVGAKGQSMIGTLCTVRHKGIDILFTHQSIAKITTSQWQGCSWLRLHHQVDDVTRYKNRIPSYELVRIAQLIVNEQYDIAVDAFKKQQLEKSQYVKQKSFFVYVDMRGKRIKGCSKQAFIRATKKFIDQEQHAELKKMMHERHFKTGTPIYKNRNEALIKLIKNYLNFFQP